MYDMDLNGDVIFMYLHMYICIFLYNIYIWEGFLLHPVDCGNHVEMS